MLKVGNNIEDEIKSFMNKEFLFEFDEKDVTYDTNLFSGGYIDSFGFVQLISFLEKKFEIKITDEELLSDSFNTLNKIIRFVRGKIKNDS